MKTKKNILIVLTVLLFTCQVQAEENYWQVLKQIMTEDTPEASAQFKEYINSLSADELIIAARQCSDEIQSYVDPNSWDMAIGSLGFFYQYYPLKTNNLEDISPLLNDLKDKSQSVFWRRAIMELLGSSWHREFSNEVEKRINAAEIMCEIYKDNSENVLLKPKAIRRSTELLQRAYFANLRNDPNVEQLLKDQKMKPLELINAVRSGKINILHHAIQVNERILAKINKSIITQQGLFSDKATNPAIKESIIVSWARYHKSNLDTPQVSQILAEAVDHYEDYDEKLWYLLVKTNVEDFGNHNALLKSQNMLDDLRGKLKAEKDKSKKNQIQSKIESFERIIKQQELKKSDDPNAAKNKNKGEG